MTGNRFSIYSNSDLDLSPTNLNINPKQDTIISNYCTKFQLIPMNGWSLNDRKPIFYLKYSDLDLWLTDLNINPNQDTIISN